MSFGIAKTTPAKRGFGLVAAFYDGTLKQREFHVAGKLHALVMVEVLAERLE